MDGSDALTPEPRRDGTGRDALKPYLLVLVVGVVLAVGVLAYAALYRDEIIAILTQSPT